ncbi:Uncharacterised protein [Mycobacteroides abscessus subsp. abscessus]|nr:Uncharacterised protein [Mycobacteroides abscessus subsp. abscessus]
MDLEDIEVLEREPVAREQAGHRVGRGHEEALGAVDEVHGGGLGVDDPGQRGEAVVGGPLLAAEQDGGCAVGERRRVACGHRRRLRQALAEDRGELREGLEARVGPEVRVPAHPEVGGDEVVEEALVPRAGKSLVGGQREFVLRFPADPPGGGRDRLVLTHAQARPRLTGRRGLRSEVGGPDLGGDAHPLGERLSAGEFEEDLAQRVPDDDRGVGGGVDARGDAGLDLSGVDLVRQAHDGLESGRTGLADVEGRSRRGQCRSEHGLTGEVEVLRVLEHGTAGDFAHRLPGEAEAGDEAVDRRGEHVEVARLRVLLVRAGEGDAVAAEDDGAVGGSGHWHLR